MHLRGKSWPALVKPDPASGCQALCAEALRDPSSTNGALEALQAATPSLVRLSANDVGQQPLLPRGVDTHWGSHVPIARMIFSGNMRVCDWRV
ncbi:hypothetical protein EYF80_027901 [Liparis tanakae]|uniref:Uncharacterized protein n=1 Tax=Liparis tanakae TaxID=230148 RepID=A0A4Z2H9E9_9TELE|nr:hypothetical protein EYF80_027901 [Liparis tanakae]